MLPRFADAVEAIVGVAPAESLDDPKATLMT
jgi:hypothetical protein